MMDSTRKLFVNSISFLSVMTVFVIWTEMNPRGVACGGVSTACGAAIKNIRTGIEIYAFDHNGQYPPNLRALVPNSMNSLPKCSGTFNGCRVITLFGIRRFIAGIGQPKIGPAAIPHYRSFIDSNGKHQFELICRRKHNGQKRYYSQGQRLETDWQK